MLTAYVDYMRGPLSHPKPGWRNWLARTAFNRKAASSTLASGIDIFSFAFLYLKSMVIYFSPLTCQPSIFLFHALFTYTL